MADIERLLIDVIVHVCDKSNATLERRIRFRVKHTQKKTATFNQTEPQNLLNKVEMLWTSALTRGKLPMANYIKQQ